MLHNIYVTDVTYILQTIVTENSGCGSNCRATHKKNNFLNSSTQQERANALTICARLPAAYLRRRIIELCQKDAT